MFNEFCSGYLLDKNYAHNMYIVQMHSTLNFTSALTYFYTFQSSQGEMGQGDHNTDSNKDPITVMVLGAGRGPIVRATFNAADLTNTKVKVSPVFILSSIIFSMMLFSITTMSQLSSVAPIKISTQVFLHSFSKYDEWTVI